MPDTLAQKIRAKYPGVYDDLDDAELESKVRAKFPGIYDDIPSTQAASHATDRRPVAAEDYMTPEEIANRDMTAFDVVKGFGKGALRSVANIVNTASQTRLGVPGSGPLLPSAVIDRFTPDYTNDAQRLGGRMETAAELVPGAIGAARGAAGLVRAGVNRFGPELMRAGTSDVGVLTQLRQAATKKILGRVIEMAKQPAASPNAGGRVVQGVGKNVDNVIADELDLEQQLTKALEAVQKAPKPTLPPPAQLPAGYTPRATAPKLVPRPAPAPAAAAPTPRPTATHGPKNYFLKQTDAPAPTKGARRELTLDDLPESWRSRVGDVAPPQGIAGADYAKAAADVLSETGVSAKDAILAVSKNPSLPPGVRLQLISALKKAGGIGEKTAAKLAPAASPKPAAAPTFESLSNRMGQIMRRAQQPNVPDDEWNALTTELSKLKKQQAEMFPNELAARDKATAAMQQRARGY